MKHVQNFLNYKTNEILPYIYNRFLKGSNLNEEIFKVRKGWLNRVYFLSVCLLPAFIYLRDNNLLEEDVKDYNRFISLENIILQTKSDSLPDYLKTAILFYLSTIPDFNYEMLNAEPLTQIVREQHGYLQVHYSEANFQEEIMVEKLKKSLIHDSIDEINRKIDLFLTYYYSEAGDMGWKGRHLKLSSAMLPAFLYLRDNNLLENFDYPDFLNFDNIIKVYYSKFIPEEIKLEIINYLNMLPGFDINLLNNKEIEKSVEHHKYIQMIYFKINHFN